MMILIIIIMIIPRRILFSIINCGSSGTSLSVPVKVTLFGGGVCPNLLTGEDQGGLPASQREELPHLLPGKGTENTRIPNGESKPVGSLASGSIAKSSCMGHKSQLCQLGPWHLSIS